MRRRAAILLAAVACATPGLLSAQSPQALVEDAVQAYGDLALDDAAWLLRHALDLAGPDDLNEPERARALMFLGATEVLRNNADSAGAAFRNLVLLHPRYRPDELIFPPDVTAVFETVRQQTKTVRLRVPPETAFRLGQNRLAFRALASSPHEIVAEIAYEDGRPARTVYTGPIGDSLALQWDARDARGRVVESGRYLLNVTSRDATGQMVRLTRVPLDVDVFVRDTLSHPEPPADSLLLPETYGRRPSLEALIGGLAVGAATFAIPAVVAPEADLTSGRIAIAGAATIGGIIGFITRGPGEPIRANIEANNVLRQAWRDSVDVAIRENRTLRADIRVRIRAGEPVRIEGTAP